VNTTRLRSQWEQLPEPLVRRLQARKLHDYLRTVVLPFSPHYRKVFGDLGLDAEDFRSLADLERLPFTAKTDLMPTSDEPKRFTQYVLAPDPARLARRPRTVMRALLRGRSRVAGELAREFRPVFIFFTTGRAAEPIPFLLTRHDLANLESASRRLMQVCEARPEFRMINAFPYAPHLAFWFAYSAGVSFGALTVSSGGGKVAGTEGNLRLLRKLNPEVLIGVPTFIYHLLSQAVEQDVHCDSLKRIVLGGEKVSEGMRRKLFELAAQLGAREPSVLATYGFTEAKLAWAECPFASGRPSGGYHLYPDLGIVEIIDPKTGRGVEPGCPGEIVFTPLEARGSVVLRYRTGDYLDGGLTHEPCPHCGRTVPRLVGAISRSSEIKEMKLDKLKGTLVDFNHLEHVLDDAPHVGAWQLEIRQEHDDPLEIDRLILHVHKTGAIADRALARELRNRFFEYTEIHPNRILFHNADELRRLQGVGRLMKEQKIVDNRPAPAVGAAPAPMPDREAEPHPVLTP